MENYPGSVDASNGRTLITIKMRNRNDFLCRVAARHNWLPTGARLNWLLGPDGAYWDFYHGFGTLGAE